MKLKLIKNPRYRVEKEGFIVYFGPEYPFLFTNLIGKRILDFCNGENTTKEIIDKITNEFDVPLNRVKKEVSEFIEKLKVLGLVEGNS